MERKIGEIFEYKGEWYQCVEGTGCYQCAFNQDAVTCLADDPHCTSRSDRKDVFFKRLEKVGEPITEKGRTFQKLTSDNCSCTDCVFNALNKECYKNHYIDGPCRDNEIWVEIKQNKEDTMEETKLNIKPFSLEAAKAGKPVCTRDGRKARIICFDAKGDKPIIALVEMGTAETPNNYPIDGKAVSAKEASCDLMMLPEKKEGWVNVYNSLGVVTFSHNPYDTKKEALANAKPKYYVDTVKIEWEE